jgi:hypothetical protein
MQSDTASLIIISPICRYVCRRYGGTILPVSNELMNHQIENFISIDDRYYVSKMFTLFVKRFDTIIAIYSVIIWLFRKEWSSQS